MRPVAPALAMLTKMARLMSFDDKETLARGNWLELVRDGKWEFVRRVRGSAAAAIIAITDDHEIVVVEQFRPAMNATTLELPAGIVGDEVGSENEARADAARRELEEETGYRAAHMEFMYEGASSTGLTNETCSVFRAHGLTRVAAGGGVEGENITVHLVALAELHQWLKDHAARGYGIDVKLWGVLNNFIGEK
jgi:ADP-ribose pyrophosphatase